MQDNKPYIPTLNFKETIDYSENLRNKIFDYFKNKNFKIITIDLPLSANIKSNINGDSSSLRSIDFDNVEDFSINEIINFYDNLIRYIYYYYEPSVNSVLFSKYTFLDRDKKISDLLNETTIYNFEIPFKESDRLDAENKKNIYLSNYLTEVWENIFLFAANDNRTSAVNLPKNFASVSSKLIQNLNPLFNFNTSLKKYIQSKKVCAVFYNKKNFISKFGSNFLESYDADNTVCLYAWLDEWNDYTDLITVTIRPNWEIIKKQKNILTDEQEKKYNNEFYEITKNGLKGVSLSIKINFDKLLIYLLNKHYSEEITNHLNSYCLKKIFSSNGIIEIINKNNNKK